MRPGSDTVLLTPLHPPLHLSPFSPQPRSSFSQQQLHQQIRVRGKKLSKTIKDFLGKLVYNIFITLQSYLTFYFINVANLCMCLVG